MLSRKPACSSSNMESGLQRRIQKALRKEFRGAFVRKIHVGQYQSAGIPDLLVVVEGYAFLLEVKPDGEFPSRIQLKVMREARNAGACSCVVRSPDDAIDVVRYVIDARGVLQRSVRAWIMFYLRRYRG